MDCPRCGSAAFGSAGACVCACCGHPTFGAPDTADPVKDTFLWENPQAFRYPLSTLWRTLLELFIRPAAAFRSLATESSPGRAWLYGLLVGSIGIAASAVWSHLQPAPLSEMLREAAGTAESSQIDPSVSMLFFAPAIISLQLFFAAFYFQLVLLITRSRKKSFSATFKIAAYAQSAMVLQVLPFIGMIAGPVFWVYLVVSGIHAVHRISRFKAFVLIFAPLLLLAFFLATLAIIAVAVGLLGSDIVRQILFKGAL